MAMVTKHRGHGAYDTGYGPVWARKHGEWLLRSHTRGLFEKRFRETAADRMPIFLVFSPGCSTAEADQGREEISAQKIFPKYLEANWNQ
ncbi:MAG: hypothetical protein SWQ30_13445 [Thermodesulfobacteriota bacterium]|nr:hypothetical protein [Thermodesulfobacteriota bacterium]